MFTRTASRYRTLILALTAYVVLSPFLLLAQHGRGGWTSIGKSGEISSFLLTSESESRSQETESPPPSGAVHALFDLDHPETGPFPTDIFTVADRSQNTGRRVNTYPDCAVRVSDCEDLDVINTLDGFGLQTRISIPFDGLIDPATVTDETVFVVSLSSTQPDGDPGGKVIGINQVVWDPGTLTLHVEVNELKAS